jgi:hypothetical protein
MTDHNERPDGGTHQRAASRQDPAPATRTDGPEIAPSVTRVELVIVDGERGMALLRRQAHAVATALQWLAEHPSGEESSDDS